MPIIAAAAACVTLVVVVLVLCKCCKGDSELDTNDEKPLLTLLSENSVGIQYFCFLSYC